ncbi:hypothetical protein QBC39DRAFT_58430 [Podospora conica]|nr:hypothetical protein QBC39DRAFT_58430 [Schizothecium conicum]
MVEDGDLRGPIRFSRSPCLVRQTNNQDSLLLALATTPSHPPYQHPAHLPLLTSAIHPGGAMRGCIGYGIPSWHHLLPHCSPLRRYIALPIPSQQHTSNLNHIPPFLPLLPHHHSVLPYLHLTLHHSEPAAMRFSIFALALSGLGDLVAAVPDPAQIATGFQSLTTKCQTILATAKPLNVIEAPKLLIGYGSWHILIRGFNDMDAIAQGLSTYMDNSGPATPLFTGADASVITGAFSTYRAAQTALLDVVINAGRTTLISPSIRAVVGPTLIKALRGLEGDIDRVSFKILSTLGEGYTAGVSADLGSVLGKFDSTVDVYGEIL